MTRASANRVTISATDHVLLPAILGADGSTFRIGAMRPGYVLHGWGPRQNCGGLQTTEEDWPTRAVQQPIVGCVEVDVRLQPGEIGTREGEAQSFG